MKILMLTLVTVDWKFNRMNNNRIQEHKLVTDEQVKSESTKVKVKKKLVGTCEEE